MEERPNKEDRKYGLNCDEAIDNPKCRANSTKLISRRTCRNECSSYNYVRKVFKKSCEFKYH